MAGSGQDEGVGHGKGVPEAQISSLKGDGLRKGNEAGPLHLSHDCQSELLSPFPPELSVDLKEDDGGSDNLIGSPQIWRVPVCPRAFSEKLDPSGRVHENHRRSASSLRTERSIPLAMPLSRAMGAAGTR